MALYVHEKREYQRPDRVGPATTSRITMSVLILVVEYGDGLTVVRSAVVVVAYEKDHSLSNTQHTRYSGLSWKRPSSGRLLGHN